MKNKKQRGVALLLAATCIAGFALTGCQKSDNTSTSSGASSTPQKITLRFMTRMSGTDAGTAYYKDIIAQFQKKYPNVTIQDESLNDETSFNNKMKTDIASGKMADLIMYPGIANLVQYAKNGVFMNLQPVLDADPTWKSSFDGLQNTFDLTAYGTPGIYAIPFTSQYEVFYYNTDLFSKAGISSAPQTWKELLSDIDKLKAAKITPWAVGAKNPWRVFHINTAMLYKYVGVNTVKNMGSRKAKWTDPDVVQTFQYLSDLVKDKAFEANFTGVDYDSEKQMFNNGQAAMCFDGSWRISTLPESMQSKIKTFRFPCFENKTQYKDNDINYPAQFEVNAKITGAEKDATINFIKMFTSKDNAVKFIQQTKQLPATEVNTSSVQVDPVLKQLIGFKDEIKVTGSDSFAYDPLPQMEQKLSDAVMSVVMGGSPSDACKTIQQEIDSQG